MTYLEETNQLSRHHHAYRSKTNTITALIEMMDNISTATDANLITATMSIDLTAAFDCVSHRILQDKLRFYGIDNGTLNWIDSYLESRSSFVEIGSARSRIVSTPHGVPQGSCLGPLLYLIYVNEMPHIVEDIHCNNEIHKSRDKLFPKPCPMCGTFPMFADDGMFQISSNNRTWNQDRIELMFWRITAYLNANGLQVNQSKTNLSEFMMRQKCARIKGLPPDMTVKEEVKDRAGNLKMEDKHITDKDNCRILGLTLKTNLTWESHLNTSKKAILPAVRRQIGFLSKLSYNMSKKVTVTVSQLFSNKQVNLWNQHMGKYH